MEVVANAFGRARSLVPSIARPKLPVALLLVLSPLLIPAPAQAGFGVAAVTTAVTNRDGTLDVQAGSHPFDYSFAMTMRQGPGGGPEGSLRAVAVDLPPGLVGNPLAVPRCGRQEFEGATPRCPGNSQIGIIRFTATGLGQGFAPLYNLAPPPGVLASFGFGVEGFVGVEQASLRTGGDFGLSETIAPVAIGDLEGVSETIWGVPADPGHDAERFCRQPDGTTIEGCESTAPEDPLLTLPTSCGAPLETVVRVESVEGAIDVRSALLRDPGGNPAVLVGCQSVPFGPEVAVRLGSVAADSPTGATVDVHLPQPKGSEGRAEAALEEVVVELPEGVAINPPVAAGLASCSAGTAECPGASKLGALEIDTPLVDHPLRGGVYLATPHQNPFASLLVVYLALDDEESGIVLKLPGLLEPDPVTGRLTLRLEELPQLPFEDLKLSFPEGPRAALRTPTVCGAGLASARLTPWTAPDGLDAIRTGPFHTSVPAGGAGACPADEEQAPNAPTFSAGTLFLPAGEYSPFGLRLAREDGSQRLAAVAATLPPGITARLSGIPPCADAEIASRSCPPDSQVGTVDVGLGAGSAPLRLSGKVHLAGPYKGAPLSLAIDVPAVAGPFDLGAVTVRVALYVDRRTAQIHAVSDPLPTILSGIPLDIRSLALNLDRPGFVLNPTSCEPTSITARTTSTVGQSLALANRFQVGNCRGLGFEPKVSTRLLGSPARGAHPRLRAILTTRPGDANLRRVAVTLPRTELLDTRHVRDVCAPGQFAVRRCPAASGIGHVRVWSPLLDRPLEGTVFLKGGNGRLPELAAALHGQVEVEMGARLDSASERLRVTFRSLPDVPIAKLVLDLRGGKGGLLANAGGVCNHRRRLLVELRAQSGRSHVETPKLRRECGAS
jgi:hypothetical protein